VGQKIKNKQADSILYTLDLFCCILAVLTAVVVYSFDYPKFEDSVCWYVIISTDFAFILESLSYRFKIVIELSRYNDWATGCVAIPVRGTVFLFSVKSPQRLGPHAAFPLISKVGAGSPVVKWLGWGSNLFFTVMRLRVSGAIPPLPICLLYDVHWDNFSSLYIEC
jgi:hypothetical protein